MLYDFEDDPQLYLTKQKSAKSDGLGMSVNDPVGGVPFQGRISSMSSQQILAWGTLGFQADVTLYCLRDDLQNGDVVRDSSGLSYLVQSRSFSLQKGTLHTFFKYALKNQTLS